jgi:hypothetical protein
MDPFLVVVHNLIPASSDMLDLGAKYLIGTLNYTPRPDNIIIRLPLLLLFFAEQNLSALSRATYCLLYYNNFCFRVSSKGSEEYGIEYNYNSSSISIRLSISEIELWH